jgi:hypothetical protein
VSGKPSSTLSFERVGCIWRRGSAIPATSARFVWLTCLLGQPSIAQIERRTVWERCASLPEHENRHTGKDGTTHTSQEREQ